MTGCIAEITPINYPAYTLHGVSWTGYGSANPATGFVSKSPMAALISGHLNYYFRVLVARVIIHYRMSGILNFQFWEGKQETAHLSLAAIRRVLKRLSELSSC